MKDAFNKFMRGRYGGDELGEAMKYSSAVLLVIAIFLSFILKESKIPYIPFVFALIFFFSFIFRYFSKNTLKRSSENYLFLAGLNKKAASPKKKKPKKDRKNYLYFKCPYCKEELRVPKGKGKLKVRCPKCKNTFEKKS